MSLQEGIMIGNSLMNTARTIEGSMDAVGRRDDRERKLRREQAYNKSLDVIKSGDEATVTAYRKDANFDHSEFIKAQGDIVTLQGQTQQAKAARFQGMREEITTSRAQLNDIGMKGFATYDSNPRAANGMLVKGWDSVNSGDSMKISADGKTIIVTDNKTQEVINEIPMPDRQGWTDLYSKVNTQEFDKSHIENREKIVTENADAYKNPIPYINPETQEEVMLIDTVDQRTGVYKPQYEKRDGTTLTKKEFQAGGFVKKSELQADEKHAADLKRTGGKGAGSADKAFKIADDFLQHIASSGTDSEAANAMLENTNAELHRLGSPGFVREETEDEVDFRRETAVEFALNTMKEGEFKEFDGPGGPGRYVRKGNKLLLLEKGNSTRVSVGRGSYRKRLR